MQLSVLGSVTVSILFLAGSLGIIAFDYKTRRRNNEQPRPWYRRQLTLMGIAFCFLFLTFSEGDFMRIFPDYRFSPMFSMVTSFLFLAVFIYALTQKRN